MVGRYVHLPESFLACDENSRQQDQSFSHITQTLLPVLRYFLHIQSKENEQFLLSRFRNFVKCSQSLFLSYLQTYQSRRKKKKSRSGNIFLITSARYVMQQPGRFGASSDQTSFPDAHFHATRKPWDESSYLRTLRDTYINQQFSSVIGRLYPLCLSTRRTSGFKIGYGNEQWAQFRLKLVRRRVRG